MRGERAEEIEEQLRIQHELLAEAHRALDEERARYEDLFEFAPEAYLVTDGFGVVREANRRAELLCQRERRFLLGKPLAVFVHPRDRAEFRRLVRRAAAGGRLDGHEITFGEGEGEERRLAVATAPMRAASGAAIRWLLRDVTERHRHQEETRSLNAALERRVAERTAELERERELLEGVLRQLPAGVVIAEAPSGRIVLANPLARELVGAPLKATSVEEYGRFASTRPDGTPYASADLPLARAVRSGEAILGEEIEFRHGGESVVLAVSAAPIREADGRIRAAVAAFHDVTERRLAEARDRLLAEAGEVLGGRLGAGTILADLTQLAVPGFADGCAAVSAAGDGSAVPLAIAYVEPSLRDRVVAEAADVLAAGEGHLRPDVVGVPLPTLDPPRAALVFVRAAGARAYDRADLALARELGRRAALGVENARLLAQLESERDRLGRLLERLNQGVVTVGPGLRIEFLNADARAFLGRPRVGDRLPEPWQGFSLRAFAEALFESAGVAEERVDIDAERSYVVTGIPARESESAVLLLTDATERERRQRAERAFVANASHELRTPLAAITAAVDALQAGAKEEPDERDRFLLHLERETARLGRLTRALLVLARAQTRSEAPRVERVELRSVLDEVAASVGRLAGSVVEVDCPRELAVLANRDLVEQALANLGENAVKHGGSTPVRLRARALEGAVAIEVSDAGPGIHQAERGRVFDRFYRSGDRGADGFGLGLALVSETVEALGGAVELQSEPGEGTTARIVLPARGSIE